MAVRLSVSDMPDLTVIRVAGRLGDHLVAALDEACHRARRPLVLDLSQLIGASHAGVLLLRRLAGEGVHLLGTTQYVTLLLAVEMPAGVRPRQRRRQPRPLAGARSERPLVRGGGGKATPKGATTSPRGRTIGPTNPAPL